MRGGTTRCFVFRATVEGKPLANARIGFAGRRARTAATGRARICRRVYRPLKPAWATKAGHRPGRARVAVTPRRR